MRNGLAIATLLALSLIGCGPTETASNNTPATVSNTPVETNTPELPANNAAVNSETSANNTPTNSTTGVHNPSRIFQLDKLAKVTIKTKGGDLNLWIMDDEDKRREGMMFLENKEVKDNEGMIFVFPEVQKKDGQYGFWMHNTVLPLDIAYIGKDKKVVNVGKGKPFSDDQVKHEGDYFYVIETKQGMAEKFGIVAGQKVEIPLNLVGKP